MFDTDWNSQIVLVELSTIQPYIVVLLERV